MRVYTTKDLSNFEKVDRKLLKRDRGAYFYISPKTLEHMGWDQDQKVCGVADKSTGHITIWRKK